MGQDNHNSRRITPRRRIFPLQESEKFVEVDESHTLTVIQPQVSGLSLPRWASENAVLLEKYLLSSGAILLRNFGVTTPEDFRAAAHALSGDPKCYTERSSPRHEVIDKIYTSTDYPAVYGIPFHNENAYAASWPSRISFWCDVPAAEGGETVLTDCRKVYRSIDAGLRKKFAERGILYVRNFGAGLGLSWQSAFQSNDKVEVEAFCVQAGYRCEWNATGGLRTSRIGQAIARHPLSQEWVWFNHAAFFHASRFAGMFDEQAAEQFDESELPYLVFYGNGDGIEASEIDKLRAAYDAAAFGFEWRAGDVLLLDNMLIAHGRRPYSGPRNVLVAMGMTISADRVEVKPRYESA